ncbi:hypothetical protein Plhal710r2_c051g0157501 [Plasmopara halstedii]
MYVSHRDVRINLTPCETAEVLQYVPGATSISRGLLGTQEYPRSSECVRGKQLDKLSVTMKHSVEQKTSSYANLFPDPTGEK